MEGFYLHHILNLGLHLNHMVGEGGVGEAGGQLTNAEIAGLHCQRFWLGRCEMGLWICFSNRSPGDTDSLSDRDDAWDLQWLKAWSKMIKTNLCSFTLLKCSSSQPRDQIKTKGAFSIYFCPDPKCPWTFDRSKPEVGPELVLLKHLSPRDSDGYPHWDWLV